LGGDGEKSGGDKVGKEMEMVREMRGDGDI
jgi:hypothetical protein